MKTDTRKETNANRERLGAELPQARSGEAAGTPCPPGSDAAFDPADPLPGEVSRLLALQEEAPIAPGQAEAGTVVLFLARVQKSLLKQGG